MDIRDSRESQQRVGPAIGDSALAPDTTVMRGYFQRLSEQARLAVRSAGADELCLVLSSLDPEGGLLAKRFSLGAVDAMIREAVAWNMERRNIYMAPVLYRRASLPRNSRGREELIALVLGLGADVDSEPEKKQDAGVIEELKPAPTYVLLTSQHQQTGACMKNYGLMFLFDRPLTPEQAQPISERLCKFVRDRDGSTSDINHIWRVPGALNWVTQKKAGERGLSWPQPPRIVTIEHTLSSQQLVNSADLCAFLEVEAEGAAVSPTSTTSSSTTQELAAETHPLDRDGRLRPVRDIWDGNPAEETRLLDALRHIEREEHRRRLAGEPEIKVRDYVHDMRARATWLRFGMALHVYYSGSERGFDVWRAVSRGSGDLNFAGAPGSWDEADWPRTWKAFRDPLSSETSEVSLVTVGSLFEIAGKAGFDLKRGKGYGLGKLPRKPLPEPCEEAKRVMAAGAEFHELRERDGHDLRDEFVRALRRWLGRQGAAGRTVRVFDVIVDDLYRGIGDGDGPVGCAWRKIENYCKTLSTEKVAWDRRDLWRETEALKSLGVLVASPGNAIGAHRRKGPSYAITPPPGLSHEQLIEGFRVERGHGPLTANVSASTVQPTHNQGQQSPLIEVGNLYDHEKGSPPRQGRQILRPSTTTDMSTTFTSAEAASEQSSSDAANLQAAPPADIQKDSTPTAAGRPLLWWVNEGGLPDVLVTAIRQSATSKKPDHIVDKLNKLVDVGLTAGGVAAELEQIIRYLSWRPANQAPVDILQDPPKFLSKVFDRLAILAGKYGVDPKDAEAATARFEKAKARREHGKVNATSIHKVAKSPTTRANDIAVPELPRCQDGPAQTKPSGA
ncbi:MAG: PriCT-2 domain-containing protein [Hyphomicrobiaceae bacterium]